MSTLNPDQLDYDEEIYDAISPWKKPALLRFYNHHCDKLDKRPFDESAHTQDELCKIIAAKFEDEISTFLEHYEKLVEESVRTDPAVDYLAEHFDINNQNLRIDTRYELLILLYEQGLIDRLDELIIRSRIQSYSASKTYTLEQDLDFSELEDRLEVFHSNWNQEKKDPDVILVDNEFESENLIVLKIYQETGLQSQNTFSFRVESERDEIPLRPSLTSVQYHQLKTIRFQLENVDGGTELVFTDSFSQWRTTLNDFFDVVFDVDDFLEEVEEYTSPVAKEIEEEIIEGIEEDEDPVERARKKIDDKRSMAAGRVEDLDVPDARKETLKDRISTIKISGSEIVDDQSIETQEFRLIAGLEGLFDSVDIEEGFRDIIEKAATDKQSFVLTINDRPVQFSDGTWGKIGSGTLPDKDQRALQIFFAGDDGL